MRKIIHLLRLPLINKVIWNISFCCFLLLGTSVYGQNSSSNSSQNNELYSKFKNLSQQQLFDTAFYYKNINSWDTALICFNLIINTPASTDIEQQARVVKSLSTSGHLYTNISDYRSAYKYLIDALLLSEKYNVVSAKSSIYNILGCIYCDFDKYEMAKPYFLKALNLAQNMTETVKVLNNLGIVETELKNSDSAFYYIKKSLQLREEHQLNVSPEIMHTIATIHKMKQQYDSAFYYYRLSLQKSKETNHIEGEIVTLNALGTLFIEVNNIDSALLYINRSIAIAEKKNYLSTLALNYKLLSKIAELKGNIKLSFEHYKTYTNLKESIYNANIFGDINMLQRSYEVSKTNQQIEKLIVEQRIKENTIRYQKIIWFITLFVLALVSIGLLYIYLQKRDLNKAYKLLVEKNIEVIESQGSSVEVYRKKYKKTLIAHNLQDELLDKILIQMENVCVICDTEFSINKLAELVQSNQTYVSQIINTTFKKNFRSFLNSYRIREVQRLFSEPDIAKYTFESLALRVGYKSPKSFREAFKEITGVTPNFYLKALQEGKI